MDGYNNSSLINPTNKTISEIVELIYLAHVGILTLFGNSLVILAFLLGPERIRTFTNYFVVNLAVSDLFVGCISVPFWILYRSDPSLISDDIFDKLAPLLDVLSGVTSILCLAAISLERTMAVKFPSSHINLKRQPVLIVISGTWICGLLFSTIRYSVRTQRDVAVYTASIFTVGFAIPLFIIIASYCVIFHAASHMITTSEDVKIAREIRLAKTISFVIGLFLLCWCPFFTVNIIYVFCTDCYKPKWVVYVSKMMHYSNSMMNFFIYSVRSPDFRIFFKRLFLFRRKRVTVKRKNTFTLDIDKIRSISIRSDTSRMTTFSFDASGSVRRLFQGSQRNSDDYSSPNKRISTISDKAQNETAIAEETCLIKASG